MNRRGVENKKADLVSSRRGRTADDAEGRAERAAPRGRPGSNSDATEFRPQESGAASTALAEVPTVAGQTSSRISSFASGRPSLGATGANSSRR
jgi:hypothetical protein